LTSPANTEKAGAVLTDHVTANEAMIAEMQARVGNEIRRSDPQFVREFHADTIRNYAYGTGDPNPLHYDEDYAAQSPFGTRIAAPNCLFSLGVGTLMATTFGMPGLHALYMGTEYWFKAPIKLGDTVDSVFKYGPITVHEDGSSQFAGVRITQTMDGEFTNQRGERVAESRDHVLRFDRHGSGRSKYADLAQTVYTPEEIAAIDADHDREVRRGAEPRYWEDVQEGERIPWVVKGPLTVTDCIAYKIGWGFYPFVRPNRFALEYRRKHPRAFTPNSRGIPDIPERVHWEDELARTIGIPAAFDYGPQRVSWFGHLLFNWAGDHGWIEYQNIQLRQPILIGDTSWLEGTVERKWQEDGKNLVSLNLSARDQRGRTTTTGSAHVSLPSKAAS
jgi:acyl dehydratase